MGNEHFTVWVVPVARSAVKRDRMKAETIFIPDSRQWLSVWKLFGKFEEITFKYMFSRLYVGA
jgi:hypothetical protein